MELSAANSQAASAFLLDCCHVMTLQQQLPPSRRECSAIPAGEEKLILEGPGRLDSTLTNSTEMVIFNSGLKESGQADVILIFILQ